MKKVLKVLAVTIFGIFLVSGMAMADAFIFGSGGSTSLQSALDNITTIPIGNSSIDVTQDALSDTSDSYWAVGGSGGSLSTVVVEIAGLAATNTFGIYDRSNSNNKVQLFSGAATTGDRVLLSILDNGMVQLNLGNTGISFAGNQFGFYLDSITGNSTGGGGIWYSDSILNSDSMDHMAAYQGVGDTIKIGNLAAGVWGANEYILAFEDLNFTIGSDGDYSDFVVMVESVTPVPEPTTLLLLGFGLVGLAGAGRKFKK